MSIQVEMWQPVIMEEFFRDNEFLNHMRNEDEYVVGGNRVHIPQSGGPASVQKNRSTLPAQVRKRVDTDVTYPLAEFTTDPTLIPNADKVELSYDKMASVIREETASIREHAAEDVLYVVSQNCPAGSKVPTTGASAGTTLPGTTGNRKILTEKDLRTAALLLNNQNVPRAGRWCVMPDNMVDQLYDDTNLRDRFHKILDLADYVVARIAGFNIIPRSRVVSVDASAGLKTYDAAVATDDAEGAIFWQENALARAMGDVNMFDDMGNPIYYGDIYSFLVRVGGRARRADNKGYGIIYQDTP